MDDVNLTELGLEDLVVELDKVLFAVHRNEGDIEQLGVIRESILSNGVNQHTVLALESLVSDFLPEGSVVEMFTEELTNVSSDVAMEGIGTSVFSLVGNQANLLAKVIAILVAVIFAIIKVLGSGALSGGGGGGSTKKLKENKDTLKEMKEDSDVKWSDLDLDFKELDDYEKSINGSRTTVLDFLKQEGVYTLKTQVDTAKALVDLTSFSTEAIITVAESMTKIVDQKVYGENLTKELEKMKDVLTERRAHMHAFSIEEVLKAVVSEGGSRPQGMDALVNTLTVDLEENETKGDAFWKNKPLLKGSKNTADVISYNKPYGSSGTVGKSGFKFNVLKYDGPTEGEVKSQRDSFNKHSKAVVGKENALVKPLQKVADMLKEDIIDPRPNANRYISVREKDIYEIGLNNPSVLNTPVWPRGAGGNSEFKYLNKNFPEHMLKQGAMITRMVEKLTLYGKMMSDVGTLFKWDIELAKDLTNLTKLQEAKMKEIKKAKAAWKKKHK